MVEAAAGERERKKRARGGECQAHLSNMEAPPPAGRRVAWYASSLRSSNADTRWIRLASTRLPSAVAAEIAGTTALTSSNSELPALEAAVADSETCRSSYSGASRLVPSAIAR